MQLLVLNYQFRIPEIVIELKFILYFLLMCCSSAFKLQTAQKLYVLECSTFVTCIVKITLAQNSLHTKLLWRHKQWKW